MEDQVTRAVEANQEAFTRLTTADPVLVDCRPAGQVVPGMTAETILTSGAPLPWEAYYGGQRRAVLHAAVYEELAADTEEAEAAIRAGRIRLGACHDHGCVGSVAGIYTASMPVLVVESARYGNRGFCNLYEGESRKRLNYGVYDDDVRRGLDYLAGSLGPLLGAALRRCDGIPLVPVIQRALHMGDELHSRNTAATLLLTRELFGPLLELAGDGWDDEIGDALAFLRGPTTSSCAAPWPRPRCWPTPPPGWPAPAWSRP